MALLTKEEYIAQLRPDGSSNVDTCPICHEGLDSPVTTSCRHTFCLECLKPWMERSHTCPSCRNELYEKPPSEDEAEDDDESSGADMDESDDEPDLYTSPIWYPSLDDRDTDWILDNFDGNKEYVAAYITRPGSLSDRPIREPHGYANAFLYLHPEPLLADEAIAALLSVQPCRPRTWGFVQRFPNWDDQDLCRDQWKVIAAAIKPWLLSLCGRVISVGHFRRKFETEVVPRAWISQAWPDYSLEVKIRNRGKSFEHHVKQMLDVVIASARSRYVMTVDNTYTPQPAANWASGFTLNTKFDFSRLHAFYAWNKMAQSNWTTHYIGNDIPLTKCRIEYFPLVATTVAAVLRVKPRSRPDPAVMVQLCQYEWFVIIHALQEKILELQLQDMTGYAFMNVLSQHCFQSLQAVNRGHPSYGPVYGGSAKFTTHVQMVIDQIVHEAIELQTQTAQRATR